MMRISMEAILARRAVARKPTNLSLDQAVLNEARSYGVNLSQAAESGLRQAIAEAKAEAWKRDNADALAGSNSWVERNGLPLDRFRQF
jgi:antitoxin CcdA